MAEVKAKFRKAKVWEIILGNCNSATGVIFYMLMSLSALAANNNFGVAVGTVSVFMTVARIYDGLTDGLFGGLFDHFNPTKGKLRIFIILGWVIECLSAILMYDWLAGKWKGVAGFVIFVIVYLAFLTGYTLMNVGGSAISPTLTKDPTQRAMMGIVTTLYSYAIPIILANVQSFIILPHHNNKFDSGMLAENAWVYILISLPFVILSLIGLSKCDIRENFTTGEKEEKVKWKDMFNVLRKDHNLQMFIITTSTDKLAQQIATVSYINILMAGILVGSYQASQMVNNFSQIVSIVFLFIGGPLIAKTGAKKSTIQWSWASIIVTLVLLGTCTILFARTGSLSAIGVFGPVMVIFALLTLLKTGTGMILTMSSSVMMADVADGWYDQSGKYMPGVVAGVKSFLDKFISAFSTMIAGLMIIPLGYHGTHIPQQGDPITTPLFVTTMFLMFGMPIFGWICNIISMHFYTLDKDAVLAMETRLADKRSAVKAEEEAEAAQQ